LVLVRADVERLPTISLQLDAGTARVVMVRRPDDMNAYEFVVVSALRAAQLQRGCTPRVQQSPRVAVTAQQEVALRRVLAVRDDAEPISLADD
jgi:DNA-directed RNA polymerase subunit K/omega